MKSPKELALDRAILKTLTGKAGKTAEIVLQDEEIHALQEYGNTVSIKRLGYNDHGPVHMRMVVLNAAIMMQLLRDAGIQTSIENEEAGSFDDSMVAVILAAFLHDLGMSVGRQDHEEHSAFLAMPLFERILPQIYPGDIQKQVIVRSVAIEGIVGHMAHRKIHSIEAGVLLVADGCDMERGRARIPLLMNLDSKVGDIHKYSANSIERVKIKKGLIQPIHISITMSSDVGFFQVEEVLIHKINSSTIKKHIELFAGVKGREPKQYL